MCKEFSSEPSGGLHVWTRVETAAKILLTMPSKLENNAMLYRQLYI